MSARPESHPVLFAAIEALEQRRLLAAQIEGRVLHVLGTAANDSIIMFRQTDTTPTMTVTVNGVEQTFTVADFDSTLVECGTGNDVVDA